MRHYFQITKLNAKNCKEKGFFVGIPGALVYNLDIISDMQMVLLCATILWAGSKAEAIRIPCVSIKVPARMWPQGENDILQNTTFKTNPCYTISLNVEFYVEYENLCYVSRKILQGLPLSIRIRIYPYS